MDVRKAIETRRSIRAFTDEPLREALVEQVCRAGLLAPAPHHTRPWRFVIVRPGLARERLAAKMGGAWREDMQRDGVPGPRMEAAVKESRRRIVSAPGLVLCGLVGEGLREWPDQRRRTFEWQMAGHSMGTALQNIMLAAHERGIASYWISAPLFAPEAVRSALGLPEEFVAQALIAMGYPAAAYKPRPRPGDEQERFISTV